MANERTKPTISSIGKISLLFAIASQRSRKYHTTLRAFDFSFAFTLGIFIDHTFSV
jgi:hypothetical protein